MNKPLYILIYWLLVLNSAVGQKLDKQYIDNWILNVFPKATIDESTLYIFNGIPLKNDTIEQILSKYKIDDLITINVLDKNFIDNSLTLKPVSGIIMTTKGEMTENEIKKAYKKAKKRYAKRRLIMNHIDVSLGEPVLIIDGVQIFHNECYERINKIDVSKIIGINYIDQPVSEMIYGSNGINGLIEIRTK